MSGATIPVLLGGGFHMLKVRIIIYAGVTSSLLPSNTIPLKISAVLVVVPAW